MIGIAIGALSVLCIHLIACPVCTSQLSLVTSCCAIVLSLDVSAVRDEGVTLASLVCLVHLVRCRFGSAFLGWGYPFRLRHVLSGEGLLVLVAIFVGK